MDNIAIKVENVSKVYKLYNTPIDRLKETINPFKKSYHKDFYALKNINFDVRKGETIGIIGKNGSGKSTILKIITGVLTPNEGKVIVNGIISALLELGAGFNPEYTGIENIYLAATIMGYSKEQIDKKLQEIIDFADIGEFIYQPVKTYSSGMFVRLAFAVSINVNPDILIIDEALSVGDIFFQAKCYKKFDEFKKSGKTIIFVTHDLGSIIKYCDRCIVLNDGKLISEGKPSEMVDIYKKILAGQYNEKSEENFMNDNFSKENIKNVKLMKSKMVVNPNFLEYGDKSAEIIDFGIYDHNGNISNIIHKQEKFSIIMKVKFNKTIKEPIFAFTIKDIKGFDLTGTNTMLEEKSIKIAKSGSEFLIKFEQRMILQGGNYLLSLGCTGFMNNDLSVYHRLYDIVHITVLATKNSVGIFDLNSEITIKKLN